MWMKTSVCDSHVNVLSLFSQSDLPLNKHLVATGEFHYNICCDM